MTGRRHYPPVRIFRLVSIVDAPVDDFDEDEDDVAQYDPAVVAKVLKAVESPLIYAGSLEAAFRMLGLLDEEEE